MRRGQRVTIPFIGGENKSKSITVSTQETVNLVHGVKAQGAKSQVILESAPGLIEVASLGNGAIRTRKMINSKIRGTRDLYGVFGSKLMARTDTGGSVEIGTLSTTTGQVDICAGRNYLLIVDGTAGYTYDGTTFQAITDLDFPTNATHSIYQDGFFIVNQPDTDNWYLSAKEDPTSWNALEFEASAVSPDEVLALASTESLVWTIGGETSQAYYNNNTNVGGFPYSISLSATQEVGILAPYSIAESDQGIFFLGTTPEGGRFIYHIYGQSGQVISGEEQDEFLATITDPSTAYGFIYHQAGKSFYVLQLGANTGVDAKTSNTLVWNMKVKQWERRQLQDGTAWRGGGHGVLGNKNYVGSRLAATLYEMDLDTYEDAGAELIRSRTTNIYHNNNHIMDWHELIIDLSPAVGNLVNPGKEPQIILRYSNDGGQTFVGYLTAPLGKIGETQHRVAFKNLGSSRNRVYKIEFSDATDFVIISAYATVTVLHD